MPRPLRPCATPGCPELTRDSRCNQHKRKPWAGNDRTKSTGLNGYRRQQRARRVLHVHHGICHVCGQPGATEVDHVVPLAEGGPDDETNLRPIHPQPCHRAKTQAEARRGRTRGGV